MAKIVQPIKKATPDYKRLVFRYNETSAYYDRTECPPGFDKVPPELKVEETRRPDIIQTATIVRGRQHGGRYLFFTGIRPASSANWYYGDQYEITGGKKRNSFILFHFDPGNTGFIMYYFNSFKLYPKHRGTFILNFIRSL